MRPASMVSKYLSFLLYGIIEQTPLDYKLVCKINAKLSRNFGIFKSNFPSCNLICKFQINLDMHVDKSLQV